MSLHGVGRVYGRGGQAVTALDRIDAAFATGTWTAVMGPSGSGKSTLMHCAGGLERPSSGRVVVGGRDITDASDSELTDLRRREVGFVFQNFNLITSLSAEQNVALPLRLSGKKPQRRAVRAALGQVGLADRLSHRPRQMSGGEQQRVAIARALITEPTVLFADEPTGALDSQSGRVVLDLLRAMVDEHNQTVVMVTHDPQAAARADDVLFLNDGRIVDRLDRPSTAQVADRLARLER